VTEPPLVAATASPSDTTRRANLSLVLSLLHHRGALSRADLTRATGLNRSTIAVLVAQLVELGLVFESPAPATSQIGRPSPVVTPTASTAAIAVNPEIDATTIGLVGLGGEVIARVRVAVERPKASTVAGMVAETIAGWAVELADRRVVGIGVAVPGLVRADDGLVTDAPHLGWRDEPIARLITEATGYPTSAANDASLGAGAELLFGAGAGAHELLYLNGGASGIGGGLISGGVLRTGRDGYAGELGHTLVVTNGAACDCGARGCLEAEISLARLQRLVGLDNADLDEVEQALRSADPTLVLPEVHRQLELLAVTLRNAVNAFNPERIVLGGFLATVFSRAPEHLEQPLRAQALHGPGELVEVLPAVLGSRLLMIGAAELVFSGVLADPLALAAQAPWGR
jgi:predicted NBD/HSP70 family sugar kinase